MRPSRPDIPLPPFPPGMHWVGEEPSAAERLTAKGPLLVHFFEVGEVSSVRTLAQVDAWAQRYAEAGLSTIGVHSPRSDLARAPEALDAAIARLKLSFPVCSDTEYHAWHAYGCKGWPSLFLWGRGGRLRWAHLGLGAQLETEGEIRAELQGGEDEEARELPQRIYGEAGERVELRKPSDEVFPGGSHDVFWTPAPGEPLEVEYAGAGAWASLDGEGSVAVSVDGKPTATLEISAPGSYELSEHPAHGLHEVRLEIEGAVRVWSVGFVPGPS